MARHRGGRPAQDGPREFTIRTSIEHLRVAECGLCGTLTIQDDGQLRHIAFHEATGTLGPTLPEAAAPHSA